MSGFWVYLIAIFAPIGALIVLTGLVYVIVSLVIFIRWK